MNASDILVTLVLADHMNSTTKARIAKSGEPFKPSHLVKNLRCQAEGILNPKLARQLMLQAADEIERLQQLPLL